ncbi:MAG: AbrB/MazE/SpoVT family DNA-binding domain-containing protein [Luteimonas sp.]
MLAKLTSKNQLTLPKAALAAVGPAEYFQVEIRDGVLVLTPARIQRADAVRSKLAELGLDQTDLDEAVEWARRKVAEPPAGYASDEPAQVRQKSRKTGKHKP